jgi:hypothetical protein
MAEARILRNRRFWTASSSGEVFVIVLGRTGESTLLASPSNRLLLKVVEWMLVLCVCDGDFMVVVGIGCSEWSLRTPIREWDQEFM